MRKPRIAYEAQAALRDLYNECFDASEAGGQLRPWVQELKLGRTTSFQEERGLQEVQREMREVQSLKHID